MRLKDRVCAVTGAGSGIGEAAARRFAAEGAQVALLEINEDNGRRVAAEIGDAATFLRTDVAVHDAVADAFARIDRKFGALHCLYNNASIYLGDDEAPVTDLAPEIWRKVLAVNLDSVFYCAKYAIPLIIRSGGGSVILTGSSAALSGTPRCTAYTASKGATAALTRSMAMDYGPRGVRVNCICPAAVYTPMVRQSNLDDPEFDEQAFLRSAPLRRWGQPEDIANLALFLASDESAYITGAILPADGGMTTKYALPE